MLYFKNMKINGVNKIYQLIQNGRWKPVAYFYDLLGLHSLLINFLYAKFKQAIPKFWIEK